MGEISSGASNPKFNVVFELIRCIPCSPGFLDIQINGAYDFDFSVYPPPEAEVQAYEHSNDEDTDSSDSADSVYRAGLDRVARRIVETGVTSLLPTVIVRLSNFRSQLSILTIIIDSREIFISQVALTPVTIHSQ